MTQPQIAFLGTGLMGGPMAANLLKAGFSVTAWNRTAAKAQALGPLGARAAASPGAAAADADIVITMVSDGPAAADLLFSQGVADTMKRGAVLVDMSSIKPAEARDHAERLRARGLDHLDAPVSGGTRGAEAASLAIMAGGDADVFERLLPVLSAMGRPVRVGPHGAGQLSKLTNQAIVAATIGIVAEAMLFAGKGGADPAAIRAALKGGFADSIVLQQHGERMTTGNFAPGAASRTQLKDIENVLSEAQSLGLALPLVEHMRSRYARFIDELDGAGKDHSGIYLELLDLNGMA